MPSSSNKAVRFVAETTKVDVEKPLTPVTPASVTSYLQLVEMFRDDKTWKLAYDFTNQYPNKYKELAEMAQNESDVVPALNSVARPG